MKYLKIFEKYVINPPENWKVGDIVVAAVGTELKDDNGVKIDAPLAFFSRRGQLVKGKKYEIVSIKDTTDFGQTPERHPIAIKDEESRMVQGTKLGKGKYVYYLKDNFMSLEDWEFKENTRKYNL
jgi:hypothetical protein